MPDATRPALADLTGVLLEGRYHVLGLIATGGMSSVYHGLDTRLDRPVAIKVMDPALAADPEFRRRFEREARSAARLDHPGLVDVHDQGTHGDGPEPLVFLVMELVEGGTLRDVLAQRRTLPVAEAFAVLEPVLAGLASAHRDGLVHRDVKPENVLISATGAVKVADFGLVTAAASAGATRAGTILGTPAYLAPEQVATGVTDARSDVYAAGVLLYEMLTGAPPFRGDTPLAVAYQHVNNDLPAPSARVPGIPSAVDDLVALATRRDPAARPLDAGDLALAVRRVRAELGIPPAGVPVPPPRPLADGDTLPMAERNGAPRRGGTRAFTHVPADAARPAPSPRPPLPEHLQRRRRSRRTFAIWIAMVLALGLLVGTTAWWLGTGRWTAMPSLVGVDRPAAERLIAEADLVATFTEKRDDAAPEGTVTGTQPGTDTRLLRGTTVAVTVSSGRPTVPSIAPGTAVADAERAIRDAGLRPIQNAQRVESSGSVPEGAVVRTDPAAGTELRLDSPVTLVLSSGPDRGVPFVIGRSVDEARQILTGAGFTVRVRDGLFGNRDGPVLGQDPGPGERAAPGSTVTITTSPI